MKKIEGPITDENFSLVWKYIDKKIVELKKKNMISNIFKLTSNIAFLFSMLMITYGVLRVVEKKINLTCLNSVPVFNDVWNLINPIFLNFDADITTALPQLILVALLFPFFVNLLTFLIVWIVYRPEHKEETGNKQLDSKTLLDMSKELKLRKKQENGICTLLYGFLYMLGVAYFLMLMFFKLLATNEFMILIPVFRVVSPITLMGSMGDTDFAEGYIRYAIFIVIFIYAAYSILNIISNLLVTFLYKTKVKTFLTDEIKEFCFLHNPLLKEEHEQESDIFNQASKIRLKEINRGTLTEEELEISKKSSEIIEKRTAENKKILHINPIFKIIKVSMYVLVLVLVIISVNKIKNMDFQAIYNMLDIPSVVESIPTEEIAPMIESISEEDLLTICSNISEEDYKNIVKGLSKVSTLNISEDISKEEFSSKIGNLTIEEATDILNNLTDEDLFNIIDGLPKEKINEYLESVNIYEDLYGETSTEWSNN